MHGLYLLWWVQEKQVPAAVVAAMLAAGDLVVTAIEVPTGWFADRCGHRASLIIGSILQVIGMIWCWLGEGVPGLVLGIVLIALGDAFRSGADQALLYRTCRVLNREGAFQKIIARTHALEVIALVAMVVAGGVITQRWGFAAAWIAETILCGLGLLFAVAMVEPPLANDDERDVAATSERASVALKTVAVLILPAAVLGCAASIASFLAQTTGRSTPQEVTMLVAAITLAEAAGSALAIRLPQGDARAQAILVALGAAFVAVGTIASSSLVWVAVGLALLDGTALPLRAAAIQRLAAEGVRARAASLASACDMALSAILLPLAAAWRRP